MAEDFTTFTEVDPNSNLAVTSDTISATALRNDAGAYVYKDLGAAYFDGDFSHDFRFNMASGANASHFVWGVANGVGSYYNTADFLTIHFDPVGAGTSFKFWLVEKALGTEYWSSEITGLLPATEYYCTIARDESTGTYGTLTLSVYSDSGRTTLVDSIALTLHGVKNDFQYLYALCDDGYGTASYTYTGEIGDLTTTGETPGFDGLSDFYLMTSEGEVESPYGAFASADFFLMTAEATTGQQIGKGSGVFQAMEAEGTTGATGSSSFAQMTCEAVGLDGHAGKGVGSFKAMTSQGTTGAQSDGTFFTLSGSGEIVLAHVSKGDGTFLSLTGDAAAELHAYLYGEGRFGQLYGSGTTTKGHVCAGLGSFKVLTGESEGVKGHAADGDSDLFLMTAEGVSFQRANLAGDASFFALEGGGDISFSLYAYDEYILYHRRPA